MPVVADDLMAPNGPVDTFLFPKTGRRQIAARLTQYLANAYADARVVALASDTTRSDRLARAWALYQVYTAVVDRMSAQPLTVAVTEKGSSTYSSAQIQNMKDRAAQYLAEFEGLLIVTPYGKPSQFPGSLSLPIRVCF